MVHALKNLKEYFVGPLLQAQVESLGMLVQDILNKLIKTNYTLLIEEYSSQRT